MTSQVSPAPTLGRAPGGLPLIGLLVTLIAAVLGLNLVVLKVALRYAGPVTVQAFAAAAGSLGFFAVARASGSPVRLAPGQVVPAFAVAMTLTVGSSLGIVFGVARIDAGMASVLMSTTPIAMLILGWPLLRERRTWHGTLGVVLGVTGVTVVAAGAGRGGGNQLLGVGFMLIGSVSWSLGLILMKRLADGIPRSTFIAWQTLLGVPPLLLTAIVTEGLQARATLVFAAAIAYAGLCSKGLSFFLQLTVVRLSSSVHASTTAFLIPVFGTAAGVLLLGETVRVEQLYGGFIILGGVALVLQSRPAIVKIGEP